MQSRPKSILGMGGALGVLIAGSSLFVAAPAAAATAPTMDTPTVRVGWGNITLTGTATPGSTVHLRERAYIFGRDVTQPSGLERATPWDYPTTDVADQTTGRWEIVRTMDSGFVFAVDADGLYSPIVEAPLRVGSTFSATSTTAGTVDFTVRASPDQPGIPVTVQRYTSGGWIPVATGTTTMNGPDAAEVVTSASDQPAGQHSYRAYLSEAADPAYASADNLLLSNYSPQERVAVAGAGGSNGPVPGANPTDPTPTPTTTRTPSPTPTTTRPTTPTPKPTTPKPTTQPTKPPAAPGVGSVQFTRIQYNAPGADTKTNKSISGEYFRLTNKSKTTLNLKGWTVRDRAGNLYRFTSNFYLYAGKYVVVRTGKGNNTAHTRYWSQTKHVWNNGGDAATLRTPANKTIDTCTWTKPGSGYTLC